MAKEEKQYNFGGHKFDAELYLQNLRDNADSFLQSKTDWTPEQKEEWKHSYTNFTNALQEQIKNGTDRFSTDEFGTITDRNGEFSNVDSDDFYYNNRGKQISKEDYDKLKARKQKNYTAFAANRQFANYANTIGKSLRQALAAKEPESKEFDYAHKGFASFWNKKYNPSNEKIDTKLYWSMDKDGQYTNRIAQTITDLDEYLKNDELPDNVRANIEAYKNKLQEYSTDNKDFDLENWKNGVQLAASRAGLGTWNNGFFNMGNPATTDEKKAFDINDDEQALQYAGLTDKALAHPELRDTLLAQARRKYQQESQNIIDEDAAAIKQEQDARNNKIWETYLANEGKSYGDVTKRANIKWYGRAGYYGGNTNSRYQTEASRQAMRNLQAALAKTRWDSDADGLFTPLKSTLNNGVVLNNVGEHLAYYLPMLKNYGAKFDDLFDEVEDSKGHKLWRVKNSKNKAGQYLYIWNKANGLLGTYRDVPFDVKKAEIVKGFYGIKIQSAAEQDAEKQKAQQKENEKALKNPSTPHDKKVALIKQEKVGGNPFSDKATALRAISLLTDVGSTIASFSGIGAPASAIAGASSTAMNQTADIMEGQGFWESLGNNALSYGMDALSVIPFVKGIAGTGRVVAKATKLAPHIITALGAISAIKNKDAYIGSWKKMTSTPDQLTRQDWSNIYDSLKLLTAGTRAGTQAIKGNRAMKGALSKDKVKVKTNEGYVTVDKSKLEDIKGTKGLEAQNKALQKATGNSNLRFSAARNKYLFWKTKDQAKIKEADAYDFTKLNTRMINGVEYERPYKWGELGIANRQWQSPKWMSKVLDKINTRGLKPTGRTQASIDRQTARQKSNKQPSDARFIARQTKTLRDEWKANNTANSEYQQLKASIDRARKLASSEQAAGRVTQANAYRNQAQQDIENIRNLTPEYNRLRGMVQNGNITFTGKRDASRQVTQAWNDILKKYGIKYKQGGSIRKFNPGGAIDQVSILRGLTPFEKANYNTYFTGDQVGMTESGVYGQSYNSQGAGIGQGRIKTDAQYSSFTDDAKKKAQNIENQANYKRYTEALIKSANDYINTPESERNKWNKDNNEFLYWAEQFDNQFSAGNKGRFFAKPGILNTSWTTTNNDSYNNPAATQNTLEERIKAVRNDQQLAKGHNDREREGKTYFWDDNGKTIYLSPEDVEKLDKEKFNVSLYDDNYSDDGVHWLNYKINPVSKAETEEEKTQESKNSFDIGKFWNNIDPNIKWGIPRAMAADATNKKVTDLLKKQPLLLDPQEDHRYIQSDLDAEMNGQAQAAALNRLASEPITSNANIQSQMQLDAAIKGNEAINAGRQQSNQRLRDMSEQAWQQEVLNHTNRHDTAMQNRQSIYNTANENKALDAAYLNQKFTIWDTLAQQMEYKDRSDYEKIRAMQDAKTQLDIKNRIKYDLQRYAKQYNLSPEEIELWNDVYVNGTKDINDVIKNPVEYRRWSKVFETAQQIESDLQTMYYGIPDSQFKTVRPYPSKTIQIATQKTAINKKGGTLNINKIREAAKGEKLAVAQLKAQTADADRFYKTTKDTIDRMYNAIDRTMNYSSTKKKRKKKKK